MLINLPLLACYAAAFVAVFAIIVMLEIAYSRTFGGDAKEAPNSARQANPAQSTTTTTPSSDAFSFVRSLITPAAQPEREQAFRAARTNVSPSAANVVTPQQKKVKVKVTLEDFLLRLKCDGVQVFKIKAAPEPYRKEKVLRIDEKAVIFFDATGFNWLTGKDKKNCWSAVQLKSVVEGDAKNLEFFIEFTEKAHKPTILHLAAHNEADYHTLREGFELLLAQIKAQPAYVLQLLSNKKVVQAKALASPPGFKATTATATATAPANTPVQAPHPPATVTSATPSSSSGWSIFSPNKAAPKPLPPQPAEPLATLSIAALKDLVARNGLDAQAAGFLEKKEFVVLLDNYYKSFAAGS